ncbi:carboxypeptidase Y inhibitor [Elasticomyces elasticus]|nr:carboxypeptidase Y inhibitor [Elasticomyces elasticus]KAK4988052.1 carboxypeptidase Y inhibitor [Elasticomyces elasticus]
MYFFSCLSLLLVVCSCESYPSFDLQELLDKAVLTSDSDFIYELKKAEIIPTVVDTFVPSLTVKISWENATAKLGNTVKPNAVQEMPIVEFVDSVPSPSTHELDPATRSMQYTIALTDPDAPSRDDPEWSEICHWIATGITVSSSSVIASDKTEIQDLKEVMPYKPPGPPPKTGKHRYVFLALAPANGTTETLHLSKPGDRQHWGYRANFIYSQNDQQ